jgi:hypothetical protein
MTKFKSTVLGIKVVSTLAIVILSAFVLITAEASMPAAPAVESGTISPYALHQMVDVSALPVQDGYAAF